MSLEKTGHEEILAAFFDTGTYTGVFEGKGGVFAAFGEVGGQGAYAVCQKGEALCAADVKICRRVLRLAAKTGLPVATFYSAPGARIDQGLKSLTSAKKMAEEAAKLSGVVPQIAVVVGVCGASSALAAASADICIIAKGAELFLSPPFLSGGQGQKPDAAKGAESAVEAGVAALVAENAHEAAKLAAKLLLFLPQNNLAQTASFDYEPNGKNFPQPYTGPAATQALADKESQIELFAGFGDGLTTSLASVCGNVVGIVATNGENTFVGHLCAAKAARFVRLCDAYSIPIVTLLNSGGLALGSTSGPGGMIREAARLASTYADASSPKVLVLCGRTFGTLYSTFASADLTIAVQGSVTAPVQPTAAVSVLEKDEIEASQNPIEAETKQRAAKYELEVASADALLKAGVADFVAENANVKEMVAKALDILATKRTQRMPKKHGNMPL